MSVLYPPRTKIPRFICFFQKRSGRLRQWSRNHLLFKKYLRNITHAPLKSFSDAVAVAVGAAVWLVTLTKARQQTNTSNTPTLSPTTYCTYMVWFGFFPELSLELGHYIGINIGLHSTCYMDSQNLWVLLASPTARCTLVPKRSAHVLHSRRGCNLWP